MYCCRVRRRSKLWRPELWFRKPRGRHLHSVLRRPWRRRTTDRIHMLQVICPIVPSQTLKNPRPKADVDISSSDSRDFPKLHERDTALNFWKSDKLFCNGCKDSIKLHFISPHWATVSLFWMNAMFKVIVNNIENKQEPVILLRKMESN